MGRIADLALLAAGRVAGVAPCVDLPEGSMVELPGRGRTYLVDTGPVGSSGGRNRPTLILLHALACTGLLTWYPAICALRQRYRVVAFDQRWHGQGILSDRFSLDDCADDTAAVADLLGIDRFVAVGYSMGSLVAQLVWHRHPRRLAGAVLCASTTRFVNSAREPVALRAIGIRTQLAANRQLSPSRPATAWSPGVGANQWVLGQFRSTTQRRIAAAGAVISQFDSSSWIAGMAVPTAVVVTAKDRLIPPHRQRLLARQIPEATIYELDAGHASCVLRADRFTPAVQAACASVSARAVAHGRQ
ncbi:MAG: alpha/beta hydrolase [Actinomycetota bacterium]|nr:alpha/beta hydrolase [Actinomycetota bacterium]